jgi:hypothetical protein
MFVFYNCFKFVWTWHRDLCWPVQKLRSLRAFALLGLMATSTCHHFSGCEKTTQLFFVETRLMWRKKLSLLSLWLMRKIMECIVWSHGRPLPETRLYSHFQRRNNIIWSCEHAKRDARVGLAAIMLMKLVWDTVKLDLARIVMWDKTKIVLTV